MVAAAAFSFMAPLGSTAKGYETSTVDSMAIEGQFIIAANNCGGKKNCKERCEKKNKNWLPRADWTVGRDSYYTRTLYCSGSGNDDPRRCSCQR